MGGGGISLNNKTIPILSPKQIDQYQYDYIIVGALISASAIMSQIELMIKNKTINCTQQNILLMPDNEWYNEFHYISRYANSVENEFIFNKEVAEAFREKHCEYGILYADKVFYVLRLPPITSGLASLVLHTLNKIYFAKEKYNNAIIAVDYSAHWNSMVENDEIGIVNWWEYYFEQPSRYSLNAIYHSRNVYLGAVEGNVSHFDINNMIENPDVLQEAIHIYKKYIFINKRIEIKINKICNKIISSNEKILGVAYRGTDYIRVQAEIKRTGKVVSESAQPSLDKLIKKAKLLMTKWNCTKVFLTTEDNGALSAFKQEFGTDLLYTDVARYPSDTLVTSTYNFKRDSDKYFKGEEYLLNIVILSKCDCLLTGRHGMIPMVLILNENRFKQKFIYNIYGNEDD